MDDKTIQEIRILSATLRGHSKGSADLAVRAHDNGKIASVSGDREGFVKLAVLLLDIATTPRIPENNKPVRQAHHFTYDEPTGTATLHLTLFKEGTLPAKPTPQQRIQTLSLIWVFCILIACTILLACVGVYTVIHWLI